ncbi:TPA: helix-turn-helix transcriptional regulator [Clostridium perfringens]|uniref:helix-turn-helix domain-containing protein n=1 Tax=Clostridium perfringens TaxID=1502 RepID=UPI0018E4986A|nr:helix-turn-helix transcriptional regulator [Clostridium perfringens]MBI5977075.1 helix-turn-helix transcriptional regulator [Clostridium perfringens]MBI5980094.1 helix-turn-helix transcriptional regulator [Clostridium perfringens]MBI6059870.1 helix-turn-helix transcriptional regulator [Clostridium perfringens]MDK0821704.1 helix-turn-helix transcriptional regulator [Clostridium perfringens]MDK0854466.1 helix-turn-helix transcriptional regulator [Clostridium perfringens]
MFIGYRLQKLRKKRKLTQKALAEMTGISRSYLSDIEHNRYNPSFDTIEALATALKLDLKSFFDDTLLEEDYYLKPLNEELEDERFEEIEVLSENEIVEKQIINNDLNITYKTGSLSKKEILNIKVDLEKTLNNLDNFEKHISFEGFLLDSETRKAFKESLEHSMKMAKLIAKNKFSSKAN